MKGEESQSPKPEILRLSRPALEKLAKISARFAKMGSRWLRLVLSVAEVMTINLHVSVMRQLYNPTEGVGNAKAFNIEQVYRDHLAGRRDIETP